MIFQPTRRRSDRKRSSSIPQHSSPSSHLSPSSARTPLEPSTRPALSVPRPHAASAQQNRITPPVVCDPTSQHSNGTNPTPFSLQPDHPTPPRTVPALRSQPVPSPLAQQHTRLAIPSQQLTKSVPPRAHHEYAPTGIFKDICDRIQASDAAVLSGDANYLFRVTCFLIEHRGPLANNFISECIGIYKRKYRSRSKLSPSSTAIAPSEFQDPPHATANALSSVPRVQSDALIEQPDKQEAQPNAPTAQLSAPRAQPTAPPRLATQVIDIDTSTPSAHVSAPRELNSGTGVTEQSSASVKTGDAQPSQFPVQISDVPPPVVVRPAVPPIESPWYSGRAELVEDVRNRWEAWKRGVGKPNANRTIDGTKYVVWEKENRQVVLNVEFCQALIGLQDREGELSDVHLDILRFLWHCLIEDNCSGAILSHGVGFPRTHLVLTLCHLVLNNAEKKLKSIAVFCPEAALEQWKHACTACKMETVRFLEMEGWSQELKKWEDHGGVLVCPFKVLLSLFKWPDTATRAGAYGALCRKGPDIVILDEATRLQACDPVLQRGLRRVQTKARLALTSSALDGNVLRHWGVLTWAAPDLLGSKEEFWHVYVRHLVSNDGLAERVAQHLLRVTQYVTFKLETDARLLTLQKKGRQLYEATVCVKLPREHKTLYQLLASLVKQAVDGGMSMYVAAHTLLIAATSPQALLTLLSEGLRDDYNVIRPGLMHRTVERLRHSFAELKRQVEPLVRSSIECVKIELAVRLCQKWVAMKQRPAVFTTMPEIEKELRARLAGIFSEQLQSYDLSSKSEDRKKQLDCFNTSQEGAVLLAPYGSALDCVEDSGWGFVNATHVLVIDTSWNPNPLSQVVNRVHHFGASGVVHVYHLIAVDTIEFNIHSHLSKTFASAGSKVPQRRSLLLPGVTTTMFEDVASAPQESNLDWDEELLGELHDFDAEIALETSLSRHEVSSKILSAHLPFQKPEDIFEAERVAAAETRIFLSSLPTSTKVHQFVHNSDEHQIWRNPRTSAMTTLLFTPHVAETRTFLSCWDEYFRLYEQDDVTHSMVDVQEERHSPSRRRKREASETEPVRISSRRRESGWPYSSNFR